MLIVILLAGVFLVHWFLNLHGRGEFGFLSKSLAEKVEADGNGHTDCGDTAKKRSGPLDS
jgi:hypothetical protein